MRKSYRFAILAVVFIALAAGALQARFERGRALSELRIKLQSLSLGLQDSVMGHLSEGRSAQLEQALRQFTGNQEMFSVVVCAAGRAVAVDAQANAWAVVCADPAVREAEQRGVIREDATTDGSLRYFLHARPLDAVAGLESRPSLVLLHSLQGVNERAWSAFASAALTALVAGAVAFALFYMLMGWVLRRSMRFLVRWTRSIFRLDRDVPPEPSRLREVNQRLPEEFRELTKELSSLALKMRQERLRLVWNASGSNGALDSLDGAKADRWAALKMKVNEVLRGRQLVIVANREPYSHEWRDDRIQIIRPASGVVTALEPIMRLVGGGVWVGHGSGSADREVVNADDEVRVPPESPTYTLRRVWLSKEEEEGYYYGFANEGLWPLCHLAYTRPTFRLSDWESYQSVNQKFAESTLRKIDPSSAVILVQDYHYALLPKMVRDRAPEAIIELFWHIPWPNPEAFGICPQYRELLEGMLGADVVGFHTQFHCNNFLETCDRYLECRVDWERFSVTIGNRETLVRSYPISIATEPVPALTQVQRSSLRERYGINVPHVAVGVDRLDYTKGLLERISGVERFLEKYPEYVGNFSFVEMGTPSRTNIPSYRHLIEEVEGAVERVNARFGRPGYRPVVLLKGHFDWREVSEFYQLGNACLVTSLHDGMNLVAKEYVWAQAPEQGALILSRFTGAARELTDALIINPYSAEEIADALHQSFAWTPEERAERMRRMKEKVEAHNAFHWATDLLEGVSARA